MNKYGAVPQVIDGVRFASRREANRYGELRLLLAAGQIADLVCHPAWVLTVNGVRIGRYTADFQYQDQATGRQIVEDVKGGPTRTEAYGLRKRLLRACEGIEVQEV